MALSYETLSLRRDIIQRRCLIAVLKYAVYIHNESDQTDNHVNRLAWATDALANPDVAAVRCMAFVLGNQDFLDQDLGLSDADLQGIVENVVNSQFIQS